jgi:hypothetical protein
MQRNTMKKLILWAAAAAAVVTAVATPSIMIGDAASATATPVVTTLTPATGSPAGGNTVVVTGSALTDPADTANPPLHTTIHFGAVLAHIVSCAAAPAATCDVKAPAGTGVVPVTVTDAGGVSNATISYTYASVPGAITGYAGRCIDDWLSRTVQFNKVDIYSCNGTSAQKWTAAAGVFTHAGGAISLTTLGGCMDVRLSGGANGTLIDRFSCNGTGAQLWSAYAHNQLRNPESGKCLTDVGYATNGAQLILSTCVGNPNQRWLLP